MENKEFVNKIETLEGQDVINVKIVKGMYDSPSLIEVTFNTGEVCRMEVSELIKILGDVRFKAVPKRKYRYLTITHVWDEEKREYVQHYYPSD